MVASLVVRYWLVSIPVALLVIACSVVDQPTAPEVHEIRLAKGGGGKPIRVSSTNPTGAEQGTVDLEVRVLGSGFEHPARVRLYLDGDPIGIVTIDEAEFVSDSELVTTITVAEDARIGLWDVEVELLATRRKGIGIELFEVKTKCLQPGHCNQGGPEPNAMVAWTGAGSPDDAMVSEAQGVILKETSRLIDIQADNLSVATDFDEVIALPYVVNDGSGTQIPDGQCILDIPDLSGYHPTVTAEGIAETLRNAFRRAALPLVHFDLDIGKSRIGRQHWDHFVKLVSAVTSEEAPSLLDPDGTLNTSKVNGIMWGKNGSGTNKNTWDFMRIDLVEGGLDNSAAPRTFRLSQGTIRTVGRLGPNSDDDLAALLCDVPDGDSALVTILPL